MKYTMNHLIRSKNVGNSAADADRRRREQCAAQQAHKEAMERFASLTAGNFQACSDWQEARTRELLATKGGAS